MRLLLAVVIFGIVQDLSLPWDAERQGELHMPIWKTEIKWTPMRRHQRWVHATSVPRRLYWHTEPAAPPRHLHRTTLIQTEPVRKPAYK